MILDIDPTVDFACKMLLGNPDHPRITVHFLNAVLQFPSPIVEVEIQNPIVLQAFEADKLAILDILAVDDTGRRLNIEIQRTAPAGLAERLTYYVATQLVEQIGEGDGYHLLRPSIGICLLNVSFLKDRSKYHSRYRMREEDGYELTNCLEINILELPKFPAMDDNRGVRDLSPIEAWMYFFREVRGAPTDGLLGRLKDPVFEEAIGVLEMISRNDEQRRLYQARVKCERDMQAHMKAAVDQAVQAAVEQAVQAAVEQAVQAAVEQARSEALLEGEIRGKLEGEIRGKLEGEIRGKAELIRTLQGILQQPMSAEDELLQKSLDELRVIAASLQDQLRGRRA